MDFGEWSGKFITTRATAHLGGHPVSDFMLIKTGCDALRTKHRKDSPFLPPVSQDRVI
jgi:hypothetical protein